MSIYSTRYAAILIAIPLLAGTGAIANAASNGSMTANGSLEQSHGGWRSSKLVGSTVYNSQGDSVGTINDMLLDTNGQISKVSISVGGFLGVGSKMVEVPFSKLKSSPASRTRMSAAAATTRSAPWHPATPTARTTAWCSRTSARIS